MQFNRNGYNRKIKSEVMSSINITPFVEILFTLLITFMVAAPALLTGVDVELPKTSTEMIKSDTSPIVISIKSSGAIYINEEEVKIKSLPKRLVRVVEGNLDAKILLKGDKRLNYERVMDVLGKIHSTGFRRIVLISESE